MNAIAADPTHCIARGHAARARACAWLLDRIASDGRPEGSDAGNSWSRLPWAFAICGESGAGHAVLDWAGRQGLREDGDFAAPAYGAGMMSAYPLGHLAMGALLLERLDVANRLLGRLAAIQTVSGGFPVGMAGSGLEDTCDLLSTAQAGTAAILAGRADIYERVFEWIGLLHAEQPDFPARLFSARNPQGVVTQPPEALTWVLDTRFREPRQTYYTSGIAAVFLAAYGQKTGNAEALALGHDFLRANIEGTDAQFTDLESVQACKFGWGLAALHIADPRPEYVAWLERMVDWFIARQDGDGVWAPSRFFSPQPTGSERMVKTAEHIMELDWLLRALAVSGR